MTIVRIPASIYTSISWSVVWLHLGARFRMWLDPSVPNRVDVGTVWSWPLSWSGLVVARVLAFNRNIDRNGAPDSIV